MKNIVRKIQLAKMAGVTRQHVIQECRPGGSFHAAVVGQRIDAGHPIIVAWLQKKAAAQTTSPKQGKKSTAPKTITPSQIKSGAQSKEEPQQESQEVEGLEDSGTSRAASSWADLTLREVATRFGGEPQFFNWLKALNQVETIRERRLKNEESEGSLIRRDLVETHILGLIEEQHQRLLNDLPKTVARTIRNHAQSEPPISLEVSEREVRSTMGKLLTATKQKAIRRLNKA